jgi:hypothetical protein
MTIPATQETPPSPQIILSGEQPETACEATSDLSIDVQVPESQQLALVRNLSDLCVSVITQTEKTLSPETKYFSPQKEPLLTQYTSKQSGSSSRIIISTSTQESSTSQSERNHSQSQSMLQRTIPSPKTSSTSSMQGRLCTTSQQTVPLRGTPLTVSLPCPHLTQTNQATSRSTVLTLNVPVKIFSKESPLASVKNRSAMLTKDSSHLSSSREKLSPFRAPLSPMALFETAAHKETVIRERLSHDQESHSKDVDQERNHNQDHSDQQEEKEDLSNETDVSPCTRKQQKQNFHPESLPQEVCEFALSQSQLSQLLRMRINHLDILRICAEIMKLMLNSREQNLLERRSAREHFMQEAKTIANSFSKQAQITKWLGIATATLGIFGAISPIIGEVGGEGLLNIIRRATGGWQQSSSKVFFEGMGKVCASLSELAKVSSTIYDLRANATRTIAESYKEIFRLEHDEMVRSIEELKDHWRNMDSFLLQILQTQHDAARSLYQ